MVKVLERSAKAVKKENMPHSVHCFACGIKVMEKTCRENTEVLRRNHQLLRG